MDGDGEGGEAGGGCEGVGDGGEEGGGDGGGIGGGYCRGPQSAQSVPQLHVFVTASLLPEMLASLMPPSWQTPLLLVVHVSKQPMGGAEGGGADGGLKKGRMPQSAQSVP